jgi:hypothetical protein
MVWIANELPVARNKIRHTQNNLLPKNTEYLPTKYDALVLG